MSDRLQSNGTFNVDADMTHRFGRTLWVSVIQITVLCAVSLSSHAKAMQNQGAVHLFTYVCV